VPRRLRMKSPARCRFQPSNRATFATLQTLHPTTQPYNPTTLHLATFATRQPTTGASDLKPCCVFGSRRYYRAALIAANPGGKGEELAAKLGKSIGTAIGLELREPSLVLGPKSRGAPQKVRAGQCYNAKIALNPKPYILNLKP